MGLRKTARKGAIAALHASRPGQPKADRAEGSELAGLRAEVVRLSGTIVEQAVELAALRGKWPGVERHRTTPIPRLSDPRTGGQGRARRLPEHAGASVSVE